METNKYHYPACLYYFVLACTFVLNFAPCDCVHNNVVHMLANIVDTKIGIMCYCAVLGRICLYGWFHSPPCNPSPCFGGQLKCEHIRVKKWGETQNNIYMRWGETSDRVWACRAHIFVNVVFEPWDLQFVTFHKFILAKARIRLTLQKVLYSPRMHK